MSRLARGLLLVLALAGPSAAARPAFAQPDEELARLRGRLEERWRLVPLRDGVLLGPRRPSAMLKGLEVSASGLSIDGEPLTRLALASRLGPDAPAVLQLADLDGSARARVLPRLASGVQSDARAEQPEEPPIERPRVESPQEASLPATEARTPAVEWDQEHFPHRGARVRVGGNVIVREGERIGEAVAVFGSVEVNGATAGDVVAIAGDVRLGPSARVRGDVVVVGGVLRAAESAHVAGDVTEVRLWPSDVSVGWPDGRIAVSVSPDWPRIARFMWLSGLVGALTLLVLGVGVALAAPRAADTALLASRAVMRSWLAGLAVQVLLVPALAVVATALAVSVVGIPLLAALPFVVLGVVIAALVGFTGVVSAIGSAFLPARLRGRTTALAYTIGLAIVLSLGLVGRYVWMSSGGYSIWAVALIAIGCLIEHTMWTIGLGGALRGWLATRSRRRTAVALGPTAPPVPVDV
jgi:hypothetical protein